LRALHRRSNTMQAPQRLALRSARQTRSQLLSSSRRYASGHHGHDSHHTGPTTESFGTGFYVSLAAVPTGLLIYSMTAPGKDGKPYTTRMMADTLSDYKTMFAERNETHTRAMEQAGKDRLLFLTETSQGAPRHVDHRYPESLAASSPWNVVAGHGTANIDALVAKYQKEAYEDNEKKLQQVKENKVPYEQPYESFTKITPAALDS